MLTRYMGTSFDNVVLWAKRTKVNLIVEDIGEGAHLLWMGDKRTDRVILYVHSECVERYCSWALFAVSLQFYSRWRVFYHTCQRGSGISLPCAAAAPRRDTRCRHCTIQRHPYSRHVLIFEQQKHMLPRHLF
jgi:hypothetical protein